VTGGGGGALALPPR